jgi:hypothetical protein
MLAMLSRPRLALLLAVVVTAAGPVIAATGASAASAADHGGFLRPGNLLVSGSVYQNDPGLLTPGVTVLPPGCTSGCVTATHDGSYPGVFNNVLADPSFGVTSPVFLKQLTPPGRLVSTLRVPDGTQPGGGLVTSFSSKSELALNPSTNDRYLTFMGYVARPDTIDVSNSNTPGVVDPTNPVPSAYYRAVATLDAQGRLSYTETNAYSQVNRDGTVTIWGVTSTVSGGGDQGADPNKVVAITDHLGARTLAAESFRTFESARSGEVLRGVSFTPGTLEGGH